MFIVHKDYIFSVITISYIKPAELLKNIISKNDYFNFNSNVYTSMNRIRLLENKTIPQVI